MHAEMRGLPGAVLGELMSLPFPLFPLRQGDREYTNAASEFNQCLLSIPSDPRGQIRLELVIPVGMCGITLILVPLALSWAKGLSLPSSNQTARAIWSLLQTGKPKKSRTGFMVFSTHEVEGWTARVYVPAEVHASLASIQPRYPILVLEESLAWAARLLIGRWPSDQDRWHWIYRQHQHIALFVADEIAWHFLHNPPILRDSTWLNEAKPSLVHRIREAYGLTATGRPPSVTQRRLALALVDVKFENAHPRLLDHARASGLTDGRLWSLVLPPGTRQTLRNLCPTRTIPELLELREQGAELHIIMKWVRSWWNLFVYSPLRSFNASNFMSFPGVEDVAARMWEALHHS